MTENNPQGVCEVSEGPGPEATTAWRKCFSFPAFLAALLVAATFVVIRGNIDQVRLSQGASPTQFFLEGDLWWHITVGKQILATHTWPTSDTYSYTAAGTEWIAYEWLGDVILAAVARAGGLSALAALFLVLQGTIALLIYVYAYLRCGNARAAFLAAAVLLPGVMLFSILRPQQIGYVYLLITLICMERFRQGHPRAIWALPVVFALWVNTHGSFVLGLLALVVYWLCGWVEGRWAGMVAVRWADGQRRHFEVFSLLSILALAVTPYGTRLASYPLRLALSQPLNVAVIKEWRPLDWSQGFGIMLLLLLLGLLSAQILLQPVQRVEDIILLVLAVYATLAHARFLMLLIPVCAPLLAAVLARWVLAGRAASDRYLLNAALMLGMAAGMVAFMPRTCELQDALPHRLPQGAVQYIRTHPVPVPMFNDSDWGGYLIESLGPSHKVFIDGRLDIYEYSGVLADYLRIILPSPQALPLLKRYNVQSCLVKRDTPLAGLLAAQPEWQKAYGDGLSILFVRSPGFARGPKRAVRKRMF